MIREISINIGDMEFLPDQGDFAYMGLSNVSQAIPHATGYQAHPSAVDEGYTALDSRCRGALSVIQDGTLYEYAGDGTKLYRLNAGAWTDSSGTTYSGATSDNWSFTRYQDKVIAVNGKGNQYPQQITLGGTTFSDVTTEFTSSTVATIKDFVVHGNTNDSTDGDRPERVRWSAYGDYTDYMISAATQSDLQDLKSAEVKQIVGGEYGVIICDDAIYKMTYEGPPVVFGIYRTLPGIGGIGSNAAARYGDMVFTLTTEGFGIVIGGQEWRPIGQNKVDKFALDQLNDLNPHEIWCAVDAIYSRVYWSFPVAGGKFILIYDWSLDKWGSYTADNADMIYSIPSVNPTNIPAIRAFMQTDNSRFAFTGAPNDAFVETAFTPLASDNRLTHIHGVRPVVDVEGGTVTKSIDIVTKMSESDDSDSNDLFNAVTGDDGLAHIRQTGRFVRARLRGASWSDPNGGYLKSMTLYVSDAGRR